MDSVKRFIFRLLMRLLTRGNTTVISNNCVGDLFYTLTGRRFNTPTVGLWFDSEDYQKFVCNLEYYLSLGLTNAHIPGEVAGNLGDVIIHFQHYDSFRIAKFRWDRRVNRMNFNNIVVLSVDTVKSTIDEADINRIINKCSYPTVTITQNRCVCGKGISRIHNDYGIDYSEKYELLLTKFPFLSFR